MVHKQKNLVVLNGKQNFKTASFIVTIFICLGINQSISQQKNKEVVINNLDKLEIIENEGIKVGIMLNSGGRIVLLSKNNGSNILKSDPYLWDYQFNIPVNKRIYNVKIPFNGHIVWVGPQSEWWTHQSTNLELKNKKMRWPPDPYLIYGDYSIINKTKNKLILSGPESEYTGLKLTKTVTISDDALVKFYVTAENIRKENISWDLWINSRIDGHYRVYVPFEKDSDIRMEYRLEKDQDKMPYKTKDGYFYFNTVEPHIGVKKILGKALIYPAIDKIFAFTKKQMLVIIFERYERNLVHPEHGMIEIYNSVNNRKDALLELEYHSPYKILKPGEKMNSNEIWDLLDYDGNESEDEQIGFINNYINDKK